MQTEKVDAVMVNEYQSIGDEWLATGNRMCAEMRGVDRRRGRAVGIECAGARYQQQKCTVVVAVKQRM